MLKTMSTQEFVNKVRSINTFFSVKFVKRTTGETRTMLCRTGVKKGVKGAPGKTGSAYRKQLDAEHNLITVYDVNKLANGVHPKGAFRRINLDDILEVRIEGTRYTYSQQQGLLVETQGP